MPTNHSLFLLLLFFFLPSIHSQTPSASILDLDTKNSPIPVSTPFGDSTIFQFNPAQNLPSSTRVLVDFHSTTAPSADGLPDILLAVSLNKAPPLPNFNDGSCTRWRPCLPPQNADATAFYEHANRAAWLLPSVRPNDRVFVRLYNIDRGRVLAGKKLEPELTGTLRVRRDETDAPVCGGFGDSSDECTGHGSCVGDDDDDDGDSLGTCKCQTGWGGRFCDKRIQDTPTVAARPSPVPGAPPALASAATETVDSGVGKYYRWSVSEGEGKVSLRARVLRGNVVDNEGKIVEIGGGGGGAGVFAKIGGVPGEVSENVAKLRVNRRGDGEKDTYEFVKVVEGDERQDWIVWLGRNGTVGDGESVMYSIKVGRCGGDGLDKCPFVDEEGGTFPAGIVIGACVVGGVLIVAVIIGLLVRRRCEGKWFWCCGSDRRGERRGENGGGAWVEVEVGGDGRVGRKEGKEGWSEMEEYRRRKEERLRAAAEVSIDVDGESTSASSPNSGAVR